MKIQMPTCSTEKPLFSLTVAISRRNPSRALREDKDGEIQTFVGRTATPPNTCVTSHSSHRGTCET